jgi:hypothetical protein
LVALKTGPPPEPPFPPFPVVVVDAPEPPSPPEPPLPPFPPPPVVARGERERRRAEEEHAARSLVQFSKGHAEYVAGGSPATSQKNAMSCQGTPTMPASEDPRSEVRIWLFASL